MKAKILSLEGKKLKDITLPEVFNTPINLTLIKRDVLSTQSKMKQPKGANPRAGRDIVAQYRGARGLPAPARTINTDRARLPRTKDRRYLLYGRVARVPQAVGGARAHPPKAEKKYKEKINKKERKKAREAAIAATANKEIVKKRYGFEIDVPIIIEGAIEKIKKTKDLQNILEKLGLDKLIEKAKKYRQERAGKGKKRGRKRKERKYLLLVYADENSPLKKIRNIPGMDTIALRNLNTNSLAPGAEPGRIVIWSEEAIKRLAK